MSRQFSMAPFFGRAVTRNPDEHARTASPLELFFDLVFVVAVIALSKNFHDALLHTGWLDATASFLAVFFAVWWAWMNFTWFSSSHDSNDVAHRLLTFVQMAGALIVAAGVPDAFKHHDFLWITIGYALTRVGMIGSWLRVAKHVPAHRNRALRYACGLLLLQSLWLGRLALDAPIAELGFVVLVLGELAVPAWAERATERESGIRPHFHAEHIEERYGLFTLILLGEVILSASSGLQTSLETGDKPVLIATVGILGLSVAFCAWWLYFFHPAHATPTRRLAFRWGYGHVVLFISLAALGAGIHLAMDGVMDNADDRLAALAFTVPPALYLFSMALLLVIVGRPINNVRVWPKLAGMAAVLSLGLFADPMVAAVGTTVIFVCLVLTLIAFTGDTRVSDTDPAITEGSPS